MINNTPITDYETLELAKQEVLREIAELKPMTEQETTQLTKQEAEELGMQLNGVMVDLELVRTSLNMIPQARNVKAVDAMITLHTVTKYTGAVYEKIVMLEEKINDIVCKLFGDDPHAQEGIE